MFQYAVAKSLAEEKRTIFKMDITAFKEYRLRKYALGDFHINAEVATKDEIYQITGYRQNLASSIYWKVSELFKPYYLRRKFFEQSSAYDPNIHKVNPPVYLEGYWQSPKYFKNISDQIQKEFTLKRKSAPTFQRWKKIIQESPSVAVHIRHGDYISDMKTSQVYSHCSLEYYQKALKIISQIIGSFQTFIFSDDIKWATNNMNIFPNVNFVSGDMKDAEELILISLCHHQVIANSTFSWWAAFLNKYKNKIVIAPKLWFKNHRQYDLVLQQWIRV